METDSRFHLDTNYYPISLSAYPGPPGTVVLSVCEDVKHHLEIRATQVQWQDILAALRKAGVQQP